MGMLQNVDKVIYPLLTKVFKFDLLDKMHSTMNPSHCFVFSLDRVTAVF